MIGMVDAWQTEVEERAIVIDSIDAECPATTMTINRTVEILKGYETSILMGIEHIAQILVAVVEQAIILIECRGSAIDDIVHQVVDSVDEVIVDLVAILILHRGQLKFVCHAVAQEASVLADFTDWECEGLCHESHYDQC